MKLAFSVCLMMLVIASSDLAQTGERRLTHKTDGYDLVLPGGWNSESNAEGFALVNPAKTIVVVVKGHSYQNFASFADDADLAQDGLQLVSEPREIQGGNHFRAARRMPEGVLVVDTFVMFSPHGGGVVVAALSDEKDAEANLKAGVDIAASIRFARPQVSPAAGQARARLSGKHLIYLYTASGYSERKEIILCASGTFYQSTNQSGLSSGGGSVASLAGSGAASGQWTISPDGGRLIMRFQNGGTSEYQISARESSGEIGLNGQRFFIKDQNRCQ